MLNITKSLTRMPLLPLRPLLTAIALEGGSEPPSSLPPSLQATGG